MQKKASGSKFGALGCVLDGLGRARGVPRASQERPKTAPRSGDSWGLRPLWRSWALLGTFLLFFCDFVRILNDFSSIFVRILVNFASIFNGKRKQSKQPKQAKASSSKLKEAKASKNQLEFKFKISSTLAFACFCSLLLGSACLCWLWPDFACFCSLLMLLLVLVCLCSLLLAFVCFL